MGWTGHNQQQHKRKHFRWLKYLSPALTIVSVTLLLWTYRPARTIEFWSQYYPLSSQAQIPEQFQVPPGCGPGRVGGEKVPLVVVNGTNTLLVSAYLERRAASWEVRVLAVVLRSEVVDYRCLLCCQGQPHVSICSSSIHSDHFGFAYGTADIMCYLPPGCETASHVAVTSAAAEEKSEVFLEVQNQHARSDSFSHKFTVCFSTMFDFTNVLQLVQSLEMLRLLGVSRVVVYKTSCSPETQRLLDYYTKTGLVEVIPWSISRYVNVSRGWLPEHGPGDLHYFGQIPALNDCLYRYMYQTRYMALHDMDELILPQTVDSWSELLPRLEQEHGADLCYMFKNSVFPNTITTLPPASHSPRLPLNAWQGVTGVNILTHLYHEPINPNTEYNYKIIVNPRAVFSVTVHGVLESQEGCVWVSRDEARMHHTRAPVQTEWTADQLIYDGRLLDYSTRLIPSVSAVLRDAGLISEDNGG